MAQDAGLEFSRADVVVSISRGPPGQWFPETEHWASAIFVGTSGIPPKLNYRSVKSYNIIYWYIKHTNTHILLFLTGKAVWCFPDRHLLVQLFQSSWRSSEWSFPLSQIPFDWCMSPFVFCESCNVSVERNLCFRFSTITFFTPHTHTHTHNLSLTQPGLPRN